jgi:pyridoxine 5-phosphate synthase
MQEEGIFPMLLNLLWIVKGLVHQDVLDLKPVVKTEFNIEGNPVKRFIDLVLSVKPQQVTLVPDAPDALTSNAGWDTIRNKDFLKEIIGEFKKSGIRTSIFIGTEVIMIENAVETGTDRVELYTEPYAANFHSDKAMAVQSFARAAEVAHANGLEINAGHDLNLDNLRYFCQQVLHLKEVSIGHALISDALYFGLENTIQLYLREISRA